MEQYELGAAAAWERIVALQREATQARLAKVSAAGSREPGPRRDDHADRAPAQAG